jgi:hypothetical protein
MTRFNSGWIAADAACGAVAEADMGNPLGENRRTSASLSIRHASGNRSARLCAQDCVGIGPRGAHANWRIVNASKIFLDRIPAWISVAPMTGLRQIHRQVDARLPYAKER